MATISRMGITGGSTIQPTHVTNIIDALDGTSTTTTVVATGSFSGSLVGALTGTASFATTALSASYAANVPATASYALSALSSSYAVTASFALNAGGGTGVGFPFTGSAQVTGSMGITGSLNVTAGVTASLQGTASHATSIGVVRTNINATYYPTFVDSSNAATSSEQLYTAADIAFNPNRGSIQATSVSGSITGSILAQDSLRTSNGATTTLSGSLFGTIIGETTLQLDLGGLGAGMARGYFKLPKQQPTDTTTANAYWDDASGRLYIYSETAAGWRYVAFT